MALSEGLLFGIGNPLLDITSVVTDEFLEKYKIPKDQAILAGPQHECLYEDLINSFEIDYTAGGATQNTMRFVSWILGKNSANIATFCGCIGDDYFGKMMEKKARGDGVKVIYSADKETATGTCAVLVTDNGTKRSLVAYLGAAEKFHKDHLLKNWHWVEKAKVYYLSGHSISVSWDSVLSIAHQTVKDKSQNKKFCFNLAAPYVSQKFGKEMNELMPFIDILFGNEIEVRALAKMKEYKETDMKEIAKRLANEPKSAPGPRTVIVTMGCEPVIVAKTGDPKTLEFPVRQLAEDQIVDTNGAGDAFTGGFLSQFIQDKPLETCIKCAVYCAWECIQRLGCAFPKENKFVP